MEATGNQQALGDLALDLDHALMCVCFFAMFFFHLGQFFFRNFGMFSYVFIHWHVALAVFDIMRVAERAFKG